jgi:hypothetical protein
MNLDGTNCGSCLRNQIWETVKRTLAIIVIASLSMHAGAQEYWQFGKPFRMYGVYERKYGGPTPDWSFGNGEQYSNTATIFNSNSRASYSDEAIANLEVKTQRVIVNGEECVKYISLWTDVPPRESDLRRMDRATREKYVFSKFVRTTETIVGPDGAIKSVYSNHKDGWGTTEVTAWFRKDTIDLTVKNRHETRKLQLNPALGVEAFKNPIPELMKVDEKDRSPRTFCMLDPKTGGINTFKVRYRTKFTGTISREKYTGRIFEMEGAAGKRLLYVSDKGELVHIDFDNEKHSITAIFTSDFPLP